MRSPLEAVYLSLIENGQAPRTGEAKQLGNLTFRHPTDGRQPVMVDDVILRAGLIYAPQSVRSALQRISTPSKPLTTAADLIDKLFKEIGLIWGISGFASKGFDYGIEARGIAELYAYLREKQPGLIVDGAVAQGVLGLNGVLAAMQNVPTLGCIPLQGLTSLGERTHTLVWGDTYQDREVLVGSIPDILVCVGGGPGTMRECEHALNHGSIVLLLTLKPHEPGTFPRLYHTKPVIRDAIVDGRFVVCDSIDTVAAKAQEAWEASQAWTLHSRMRRLPAIRKLLSVGL